MLDRIEPNVIEGRVIIPLILGRMLPKSSLPNTLFVFHLPSGDNRSPGAMRGQMTT
jgi:hypothetical protein